MGAHGEADVPDVALGLDAQGIGEPRVLTAGVEVVQAVQVVLAEAWPR